MTLTSIDAARPGPTEQLMRQHEGGWGATLDRLKELIGKVGEATRASHQDTA